MLVTVCIYRYYLRNNASLETLVPDDMVASISREISSSSLCSLLLLRAISSADVAIQLTRRDFDLFRSIEPAEYINDLFELENQRHECTNLTRFSEVCATLLIGRRKMFSYVTVSSLLVS